MRPAALASRAVAAARRNSGAGAGWALHGSLTGLTLVAIALVHHETVASIAHTWTTSETYNHGWLILPFAGWLIWRQRRLLAPLQPRPWWPALAPIAALELVWIAASIAGALGAQQAAVVALIPLTVLLLLGPRVTAAIAFPLGYLVFAIPWGEGLVPWLQDVTAHMTVFLLDVTGVAVYWEGRLISVPAGDFEVAEACSGVRYLIASLALGTLFAYLVYRSPWRRALFIAAAIVVPILANGVRAWGIIMLATLSDMQIAVGVDHLIYGWLFFGVVMFLLFWIGSRWAQHGAAGPRVGESAGAAAVGAAPLFGRSAGTALAAGALAVTLALAGSQVPQWAARAQSVSPTRVVLPAGADGWSAATASAGGWYTGFEGADEVRLREYRSTGDSAPVGLLVIHYRREAQGSELINSLNRLHGGAWSWTGAGRQRVQIGDRSLEVRELRLRRGASRRVVWFWYDIGGWQTTNAAVAKGVAAIKRLTGQSGDATLVALGSGYEVEALAARARLRTFLADHPQLLLPRAVVEER